MKILFLCRANVGRSQMAEAFFNRLSRKHTAISAGASAKEGEPLHEFVIACMAEIGYDLSGRRRKQVTPEIVKDCNKIIVFLENVSLPPYVKDFPDMEFWPVEDVVDRSREEHKRIRDEIKNKVERLIQRIG